MLGLPPPRSPLASVTLNPDYCTLQPVWVGYPHPVSPGQGIVATRVSRKMAFSLPEPSEVEDFGGLPHPTGSGINLLALVWPVITGETYESCYKSKGHLLWDQDHRHPI